jgi:adenylate kinase
MEVVLEEARSSYSQEIIMELKSESDSDLEANVETIVQWIRNWRAQKGFRDQ